jgi:short-subunit dehydrogenase
MEIVDRVALVTGGSSGIGREVALALARDGARLIVHGRDRVRTEAVARQAGGTPVLAELDSVESADSLAQTVVDVHGRIDLLVISAGRGWSGPFSDMEAAEIERLLTLDLTVPIALARALLPGMLSRGVGRIVLLGSVAGRTGVAGEAVYAAAKAGLDGFAESLRFELAGSGVGVSVVLPGAVDTPFFTTRGRPYDRRLPRPVSADRVAAATLDAVRRDRAEVWVPRWIGLASVVRAVAPAPYRWLAARFGEPTRSH